VRVGEAGGGGQDELVGGAEDGGQGEAGELEILDWRRSQTTLNPRLFQAGKCGGQQHQVDGPRHQGGRSVGEEEVGDEEVLAGEVEKEALAGEVGELGDEEVVVGAGELVVVQGVDIEVEVVLAVVELEVVDGVEEGVPEM